MAGIDHRELFLSMSLTWSETYIRQDLFPAGPISGIFVLWASMSCNCDFSLKSISDLDSGSLRNFFVNSYTQN